MSVVQDEERPTVEWTTGVELGMTSPTRQLTITSHADVSASILGSLQSLQQDEVTLIQWVIGPAPKIKRNDARSAEFSVLRSLAGHSAALSDELKDRQAKLEQPNVLAICRLVVKADQQRADHLIRNMENALGSVNSQVIASPV